MTSFPSEQLWLTSLQIGRKGTVLRGQCSCTWSWFPLGFAPVLFLLPFLLQLWPSSLLLPGCGEAWKQGCTASAFGCCSAQTLPVAESLVISGNPEKIISKWPQLCSLKQQHAQRAPSFPPSMAEQPMSPCYGFVSQRFIDTGGLGTSAVVLRSIRTFKRWSLVGRYLDHNCTWTRLILVL
jgi:hypothetical protein